MNGEIINKAAEESSVLALANTFALKNIVLRHLSEITGIGLNTLAAEYSLELSNSIKNLTKGTEFEHLRFDNMILNAPDDFCKIFKG